MINALKDMRSIRKQEKMEELFLLVIKECIIKMHSISISIGYAN